MQSGDRVEEETWEGRWRLKAKYGQPIQANLEPKPFPMGFAAAADWHLECNSLCVARDRILKRGRSRLP